jgi:hypothetical protein
MTWPQCICRKYGMISGSTLSIAALTSDVTVLNESGSGASSEIRR